MKEEIKRAYWSNIQLGSETPYLNGKIHGLRKNWSYYGKIWYETPCKNNLQCGARITFEY